MTLTASHCTVEAASSPACCWIKVRNVIKGRGKHSKGSHAKTFSVAHVNESLWSLLHKNVNEEVTYD